MTWYQNKVKVKMGSIVPEMNSFSFILSILSLSASALVVLTLVSLSQTMISSASTSATCVSHDSETNTIVISCDATFDDVSSAITDTSILRHEGDDDYVLDADVLVTDGSTFGMCSCDIRWLKILGDNHMTVEGRIEFEGIKITSWDLDSASVIQQDSEGSVSRPWIVFEDSEGGFIRSSEFAYLGYETQLVGRSGIALYSTHDLELIDSEFHNMWFAFYSDGSFDIKIDGNEYRNNGLYALDPHTGTHAMQITNNHVHHNAGFGIICSLDCYDILIEGNEVNNNGNAGIMLSRNTHDSIVRDNYIHDQPGDDGIFVSQSPNNIIVDNILTNNLRGISVKTATSTDNIFEGNIISRVDHGLVIATANDGNIARDNSFDDISLSEYYLTDGAELVIEEQEFAETRIMGGSGKNTIIIQNSGRLAIDDEMFDTGIRTFTQSLNEESIRVDSQDGGVASCTIKVTTPLLLSQSGGSVIAPTTGKQYNIGFTVTNECPEQQPYVALIEARASDVTEFFGWTTGVLNGSNGKAAISVSWIPPRAGTYELRTFAISDLDNPRILSDLRISEVSVAASQG